jgi:hypothetical protein
MSSSQWANIGDDEGALYSLLQRVPAQVAVEQVDFIWIFPPRRVAIGDSIVVVVAAYDEDEARRRVITVHYTVARNKKGAATVTARFDEHGAAPADAVPRIVQGVLRRMGEDALGEPRAEQIVRSTERWNALIVDLGGRPPVEHEAGEGVPDEDVPAQSVPSESGGTVDRPEQQP